MRLLSKATTEDDTSSCADIDEGRLMVSDAASEKVRAAVAVAPGGKRRGGGVDGLGVMPFEVWRGGVESEGALGDRVGSRGFVGSGGGGMVHWGGGG